MSIPADHAIEAALLLLLEGQPSGRMQCTDVYRVLADQFPRLTYDEKHVRYQHSQSHWANRVQFVVLHLKRRRLLLPTAVSGYGHWQLSSQGRSEWKKQNPDADEMLNELVHD